MSSNALSEKAVDLDAQICTGLLGTPKRLPSALFYDDLGSALFEAITMLPEYEVSRAGTRLLQAHGAAIVADRDATAKGAAPSRLQLVELGPGSGRQAKILIEALLERQRRVEFVAIDVSAQALAECERHLEQLAGVRVVAELGSFLEGLRRAAVHRRFGERRLVMFLGSNLSNFDRAEAPTFLADVRRECEIGDRLLLATDLDKPPARLLPAYDDALGVTAAFDKNALLRLNREWGANFDLANFVHEARWNAAARRVEMHLCAQAACTVHILKLKITVRFVDGESIWTESSHRFEPAELRSMGAAAGWRCVGQWVDSAWPFAQTLFEADDSEFAS